MHISASDDLWRRRLETIETDLEQLNFPDLDENIDQDEEWCEVVVGGERKRIRFHDYGEVFQIPRLYEEVFYEHLECCSPSYIVNLLEDVMREYGESTEDLCVLDVGAGNGMVGDELKRVGADTVVGIDICPDAKMATLRDRPDVYEDYWVADLTELPEVQEEAIRNTRPNCLTTVAALGFGDIPPLAFAKALDLISTPGWLAYNVKEDFLRERDTSGFSRLIRRLNREGYIQTYCLRRYQHRVAVSGEPLFYVAVVAKKLKDFDAELLEETS